MGYVDIHSHVVPSGDDGAPSIAAGLELCQEAARHGTTVLYGTPHVWPAEGLTEARELAVRRAHAALAEAAAGFGLELRLGFELTPSPALVEEDLSRYALSDAPVPAVLVEFPFRGRLDLALAVAEAAESQGLLPILAHPERSDGMIIDPARAERYAERGWPLQVNASSLLGRHGSDTERLAWHFVGSGLASLVASDGHGRDRPPTLDVAYRAVAKRLGEARADALFDGRGLRPGTSLAPPRADEPAPSAPGATGWRRRLSRAATRAG